MTDKLSKSEIAFERDIPESDREEVLTMMAEAAQGFNDHDCITILDRDRQDAINVRAHGILNWNGTEYRFILEDGNWNGTVIEDWDGDKEFKPLPRTVWTLQPRDDLITTAIMERRGPFLLAKWDAVMKRTEIAEIPGKYTYDRMMQPGSKIESYWKEKAAKHSFEIVSEETAAETRKLLLEAA